MARLARGAAVAVSPTTFANQLYVAAAGRDGVRLFRGDHTEVGRIDAQLGEDLDIGFATSVGEARLVVFSRLADVTDVRAFSVPELQPCGRLEMSGAVVPVAWTGSNVLVQDERGERVRVVGVSPRTLNALPIAMREPLQLSVATPNGNALVAARDQYEIWDLVSRRAESRVNLPVTRPRFGGFASRQRMLWLVSGPVANSLFFLFRHSDGRAQGQLNFGKEVRAADGRFESERVAFALGNAADELTLVDVNTLDRETVKLPSSATSFALLEGEQAALVWLDAAQAVHFHALPASGVFLSAISETRTVDVERQEARRKAAESESKQAAQMRASPPRLSTAWRDKLAHDDAAAEQGEPAAEGATAPEAPSAPPPRPQPRVEPRSQADDDAGWRKRIGTATAREPAAREPAPREPMGREPMAREPVAREPMVREPVAREPMVREPAMRASGAARRHWREHAAQLAGLLRGETLAGGLDVLAGSPLGDVATSFQLAAPAQATLVLLYGAWLEGTPWCGAAPLVRAVRRLLPQSDDEVLWNEALGVGELGQRRLARRRRGRCRIVDSVAAHLDGSGSRIEVTRHVGEGAAGAPELGTHRVVLADLAATARAVAAAIGHDVALVDLRHGGDSARRVGDALTEVHLEQAVPLVLCGVDLDFLPELDGRLVVVAHAPLDPLPPALAELPLLALAPTSLQSTTTHENPQE